MASDRMRLDLAMVQRTLIHSREQAKRLILAGEVLVNDQPAKKASDWIRPEDTVALKEKPRFVSRGGLKLEGALEHFGIEVTGRVCLDVGASTGGFTDCLLQRGVERVHAFDVGTNQLVWKIRNDPRVRSRENFNVRHMVPADVGEPVDLIVADVSFISLTKVLPAALAVLAPHGEALVLIKPQFELSREEVGKGGIVRDADLHEKACEKIRQFVAAHDLIEWRGLMESPIQGTDGNREFLAWLVAKASPKGEESS